ncbi:hypothetical protein [Sulfolobus acidocaldarius]|uniref:MarR family transcriptional regulator n=4 Tax=Sulfolobus acidocaldarius TaxID=2285 RepID=Q4JBE3_SULAC|nr:hypothetical protein [Sulfolobus acidocaldarius]AAY79886.1 hypothetical protein Saci_0480 [Sulfolobus acidocaldarius DSM 639]AGE70450.1 hypothetical protein SacN8_02350 [Sulfolobus acidocaldarius N8]AGE72724.1 hypothetical protein SacRon12I_02345 [Sulfolobus acidocaldarius Ron12/I]ALU30557.1 hypothetical protein ATY89_03920 [Sulfolobus acidocaldarius]ALU32821.1 hypothetical protein ATZ20_06945 [Sulfolobus acidocaldarius]
MRELSNPVRCVHLYLILKHVQSEISLNELYTKTRIASSAFYYTVIPTMLKLGLIEISYENRKKIIRLTEKGRKLLEVLNDIEFEKVIAKEALVVTP